VNDVELGKAVVPDFAGHQVLRDHSHGLATCLQHRIGDGAHQTDVSAAVDQSDVSASQLRA
jgi:hypothetical protein